MPRKNKRAAQPEKPPAEKSAPPSKPQPKAKSSKKPTRRGK